MDIVNGRKEVKKFNENDESFDTEVDGKKKETTKVGFQKVKVVGTSDTDKLFNERLKAHENEIEAWYLAHPDEKKPRNEYGRFE